MNSRLRGSAPIPPRMPKIVCTNSGAPRSFDQGNKPDCRDAPRRSIRIRSAYRAPCPTARRFQRCREKCCGICDLRAIEIRLLPGVLPRLHPISGARDVEIHAAHVEAAHLGLRLQRCRQAIVQGHVQAAAGGDVHHCIDVLLDHGQKAHEHCRVGRRFTGVWIARVQMDDGGARLGSSIEDRAISSGVIGR